MILTWFGAFFVTPSEVLWGVGQSGRFGGGGGWLAGCDDGGQGGWVLGVMVA
jgi:hypothetical protein